VAKVNTKMNMITSPKHTAMTQIAQEILMGNLIENTAWAKQLNDMLGADHPKAQKQWQVLNEIKNELSKLKQHDS